MKEYPKAISLAALGLGCGTLIVPLFTPPDPFWPTAFSFLPYGVLGASVLSMRTRVEQWGVAAVSVFMLISAYCYIDSIFSNRVFSWQVVGRVQRFLPVVQLAFGIPTLAVLAMRRWR